MQYHTLYLHQLTRNTSQCQEQSVLIYLDLTFTFLQDVRIANCVIVIALSYMFFTLMPAFLVKHYGFLGLPGFPIVSNRGCIEGSAVLIDISFVPLR